ncbi:MAG: bifunctional oligoribonuclease/PAP phosphatase NrnA [Candidatus Omnitrophica bacterium]|nr:bifunctional oligoribonuclease/PAP phosphatase NrnA [Candidatus Omnitrophota bacterium]
MKEMKKVITAIKKHKSFLVTSHINLEGDALGSQLAMAGLLKGLNKECIIYDNDKVPWRFLFLPRVGLVRNKIHDLEHIDAAIVLDCPNIKRTGKVKNTLKKMKYIINIDHHVSNEKFGNINWVDPGSSSAGEMVYRLFKESRTPITREVALALYISILTDTGSFNYSNTSRVTHEIVSDLLGYGIEPQSVSHSIYENKSIGELRLLGRALENLNVTDDKRVAYLVVRKKDFRVTRTKPSACEGFVNFARSLKGVEVSAFFREELKGKSRFNVSFRSTGSVSVNKIAAHFGGGGHKNAAGCVISGRFRDVEKKVLKRICDELR